VLARPASLDEAVRELEAGGIALAGGTEVLVLARDGLVRPGGHVRGPGPGTGPVRLVDVRRLLPAGVDGTTVGAATTLAELARSETVPEALREACRVAASPQLRNAGTIGGNLLQTTRCWYWRLSFPCYLHGGERCHARDGEHREHAILATEPCASAHQSDPAAALLALGATVRTTRRSLPLADLYRLPTSDNRSLTTLEPGELVLALDVPAPDASVYLRAADRRAFGSLQVGVAAVRTGEETRIALAAVAPIPWLLDSPAGLDTARPLPGSAWKVDVTRALVRRALERLR